MRRSTQLSMFPISRRLILAPIICLAAFFSGCSDGTTPSSTYQPNSNEINLVGWEESYPFQYAEWAASIHGQTYLSGDSNAATCNDCHDDPLSEDILAADFRLDIPWRCARCHDDNELMAEYEIADDVVETYLADFHGTTIAYYRVADPEVLRDEAICSDCHGSHAIYPAEDERSTISEVNLQYTCQKCHTGAEEAFTSAYGHYRPIQSPVSSSDTMIVFIVKLFYQALIPVTLGGMLAYIALDIRHRVKSKTKES